MIQKTEHPLTFTQKPFFVKYSDGIDAQDCCLNQRIQSESHDIVNTIYLWRHLRWPKKDKLNDNCSCKTRSQKRSAGSLLYTLWPTISYTKWKTEIFSPPKMFSLMLIELIITVLSFMSVKIPGCQQPWIAAVWHISLLKHYILIISNPDFLDWAWFFWFKIWQVITILQRTRMSYSIKIET